MTFSEINARTAPLFSKFGILKVHDVQFQLLSFVYDCHYKLAPVYFHSYFKPSSEVHNYNTRMASRGDLFLQRKKYISVWDYMYTIHWRKIVEHASSVTEELIISFSFQIRTENIFIVKL